MTLDFIKIKTKTAAQIFKINFFCMVSLETMVSLTLPASISNPNICEIIPFKNTMLFSSTEVELQIFTLSHKGREILLLFKPGDGQRLPGPHRHS